ncbi:hypothetical protein RYX36_031507, partial [Vicia faba]
MAMDKVKFVFSKANIFVVDLICSIEAWRIGAFLARGFEEFFWLGFTTEDGIKIMRFEPREARDYVDLPVFRAEDQNELVKWDSGDGLPVLAPFQLAGPMELWIQNDKDMRISLPTPNTLKKLYLIDASFLINNNLTFAFTTFRMWQPKLRMALSSCR